MPQDNQETPPTTQEERGANVITFNLAMPQDNQQTPPTI